MRARWGGPRLSRRYIVRSIVVGAALTPLAAGCSVVSSVVAPPTAPQTTPATVDAAASPPTGAASPVPPTATVGQKSTPTPTVVPTPRPTPTPAGPKEVRIGISAEPDNLVAWPGGLYVTTLAQNLVFGSLVALDDSVQPIPDLAVEVPTLENGGAKYVGDGEMRQLQVTFRIREDARWSNGDPVTSADAKFTWDVMMNPSSGAIVGTERKYEKVETPDQQTVVFTFFSQKSARAAAAKDAVTYGDLAGQTGPVVDPLYLFGLPGSFVLPSKVLGPMLDGKPRESQKVVDALSTGEFARRPVGSGPYVLSEWVAGTSLSFKARRDYYRGAPKVELITMAVLPEHDALFAKIGDGQLDLVTQDCLDVGDATDVEAAGLTAVFKPSLALEHLDLNLDDPLLADAKVRKALIHATDREAIIARALDGRASVANSVVPEASWAYSPGVPTYPFDAAKAASYLDDAGWKKAESGFRAKAGKRLALKYQTTDSPARRRIAALLKEQWKQVGVDLSVAHLKPEVFTDRREGVLSTRSFQVAEYAWVGSYDPGLDCLYAYHSRSIPSAKSNFQGGNYPGYEIAEADKLLEQGLTIVDRGDRQKIYADFQKLIMTGVPVIPLFQWPALTAATPRLIGLRPPAGAIGETWNAWEWDLS